MVRIDNFNDGLIQRFNRFEKAQHDIGQIADQIVAEQSGVGF